MIHCKLHGRLGNNLFSIANGLSQAKKLNTNFQFPNGEKISYDVLAAKSKWVIKSVNDILQKRNFDQWSLIEGYFKQ